MLQNEDCLFHWLICISHLVGIFQNIPLCFCQINLKVKAHIWPWFLFPYYISKYLIVYFSTCIRNSDLVMQDALQFLTYLVYFEFGQYPLSFFKSTLQMLIFDLVILSTSCIILDMILLWTELHASGGGLVGQRTPWVLLHPGAQREGVPCWGHQ